MEDNLRVKYCLLILQIIPHWIQIKITVNSKVASLLGQMNHLRSDPYLNMNTEINKGNVR